MGPVQGVKEGKGPWIWHLQIEDQVVEALFRDAVVEAYCRDREVMRSGRQPRIFPTAHPAPVLQAWGRGLLSVAHRVSPKIRKLPGPKGTYELA